MEQSFLANAARALTATASLPAQTIKVAPRRLPAGARIRQLGLSPWPGLRGIALGKPHLLLGRVTRSCRHGTRAAIVKRAHLGCRGRTQELIRRTEYHRDPGWAAGRGVEVKDRGRCPPSRRCSLQAQRGPGSRLVRRSGGGAAVGTAGGRAAAGLAVLASLAPPGRLRFRIVRHIAQRVRHDGRPGTGATSALSATVAPAARALSPARTGSLRQSRAHRGYVSAAGSVLPRWLRAGPGSWRALTDAPAGARARPRSAPTWPTSAPSGPLKPAENLRPPDQ